MNEYQITGWNINAEDLFTRLLVPVFMILGTELLVDWVKHAYITKFNWIRPQVYEKYGHVLCRDLVDSQHKDDLTGPKKNWVYTASSAFCVTSYDISIHLVDSRTVFLALKNTAAVS
ncbi:Endoplasmic reticulum membrane protein 65 [Zancudomyces culisetae]|uniref:Endoplasmic reticulum membrane protein 65 n=1 Tax=Zancudomyces culisetae TaxID=1213189 RepID=A0A1R1PXC6_ZANCU|nr:Endoplasmic reticulum membrane protein 65 [Zancudomyces culisetae]|eukprot:OMH85583.1 Endoplasmic reticulum membrane protein 65 [Zancudomyces culisetae]